MKINTLIALVTLMISTSCMNSRKTQSFKIQNNNKNIESEFYSFFDKFKSDSVFQVNRINFPLEVEIYQKTNENGEDLFSKTYIKKEQWRYEPFNWDSTYIVRRLDKYTQRFEVRNDTTTIHYEGIDNGINYMLIFIKRNGEWYFYKHFDLSD